MRHTLLNHLLLMRYRAATELDESWYLGGGKRVADELMTILEAKLVERKDVKGLIEIFDGLRSIFRLPVAPLGETQYRMYLPPVILEHCPDVPRDSPAFIEIPQRDASFDLDQYLFDITVGSPKDANGNHLIPCEHENAIENTYTDIQPVLDTQQPFSHRVSLLSSFTIREAKREWPEASTATAYQFPRRTKSLSSSYYDNEGEVLEQLESPKAEASEVRTGDGVGLVISPVAPWSTSLRRRERISTLSTSLSADDLGIAKYSYTALRPPPRSRPYGNSQPASSTIYVREACLSPPPADRLAERVQASDTSLTRRKQNRAYAIVDGEISPTSPYTPLYRAPSTPKVPPRLSSLKSVPRLSPSPLEQAFSLFAVNAGAVRPREGLSAKEVQDTLSSVITCEMARLEKQKLPWDDEAKRHVAWLIDQVGQLVCRPQPDIHELTALKLHIADYTPIIEMILRRLVPTSKVASSRPTVPAHLHHRSESIYTLVPLSTENKARPIHTRSICSTHTFGSPDSVSSYALSDF